MSPSEGQIPSLSCVSISVECSPKVQCGRLRTTLECLIEGDRMKYNVHYYYFILYLSFLHLYLSVLFYSVLEVTAEIQCPMLILSDSFLHIETCYRNVPVTHTLTLINTSQLHTQFEWINEEVGGINICMCSTLKIKFLFNFREIMLIWYFLLVMDQLGHTSPST